MVLEMMLMKELNSSEGEIVLSLILLKEKNYIEEKQVSNLVTYKLTNKGLIWCSENL